VFPWRNERVKQKDYPIIVGAENTHKETMKDNCSHVIKVMLMVIKKVFIYLNKCS
jgi:hypothetical protein